MHAPRKTPRMQQMKGKKRTEIFITVSCKVIEPCPKKKYFGSFRWPFRAHRSKALVTLKEVIPRRLTEWESFPTNSYSHRVGFSKVEVLALEPRSSISKFPLSKLLIAGGSFMWSEYIRSVDYLTCFHWCSLKFWRWRHLLWPDDWPEIT